jgi:hypothetical protein
VDEGPAAHVDERAVVTCSRAPKMPGRATFSFAHVFVFNAGITVHVCTSVYITGNEVEPRLGTIIEVYSRVVLGKASHIKQRMS